MIVVVVAARQGPEAEPVVAAPHTAGASVAPVRAAAQGEDLGPLGREPVAAIPAAVGARRAREARAQTREPWGAGGGRKGRGGSERRTAKVEDQGRKGNEAGR